MIDLHAHTTASDGSATPTELVALAVEIGLAALGITDHDTVGGLEEAVAAAAGPADQGALPSPPPDDSEKNEGAGIGKK